MTENDKQTLWTAAEIIEADDHQSELRGLVDGLRTIANRQPPPESSLVVAGFGHIEKVGLRWNVPGIGRVTHEWLAEALGREPVDEEKVTASVIIQPGIHP